MNWDDLRYVLAIGRSGTLAGAARELGVDATTVGRRILAIEQALGTRLFDRTADGLSPTETGGTVLARATDIEQQALAIERQVSGKDARPEGPVRLTAVDCFFDNLLIPRLGRLVDRCPGLELHLVSDIRLFDLSRREADVGIRYRKPKDPDLVGRQLGTQASALYASEAYLAAHGPVGPDGAGHRLVGFPVEADGSPEARALTEQLPAGQLAARANTGGHMLALARAGVAIAALDCYVGDSDPLLRRVRPEPLLRDELWAVVHVDMHRNARVRAVLDFLSEVVAEERELLEGRRPRQA